MDLSNKDLVAIATAVRKIIKEEKKSEKRAKKIADAKDLKKYYEKKDEISSLRKKAGLKELLNSSMASAMKYRGYTDRCERNGEEPLSYQAYWGYTDSTDYIDPKIRARLKELGGLKG